MTVADGTAAAPKLCDAICAGDADYTAAMTYAHIERGRRPTLETLRAVLPG